MQKGQTVTTRLGKGLLLSSSILLFWSPSAKAWWGKYGSKHEAREASRLWVIQGGEVTKTWSTQHQRKVEVIGFKPQPVPPKSKWVETFPWSDDDKSWSEQEKKCWKIENRNPFPARYCALVLKESGKPHPVLHGNTYAAHLGRIRERERIIQENAKNKYQIENFKKTHSEVVYLRSCFHEAETRKYVCNEKLGLRKGKSYSPEKVNTASISYKYFKY